MIVFEDRSFRAYYKYAAFILLFSCIIAGYVLPKIWGHGLLASPVYDLVLLAYIVVAVLLIAVLKSPYRVSIDPERGNATIEHAFGFKNDVPLADIIGLEWYRSAVMREERLRLITLKGTWAIRTVPNNDYMEWKNILRDEVRKGGGELDSDEGPSVSSQSVASRGFRLKLPPALK